MCMRKIVPFGSPFGDRIVVVVMGLAVAFAAGVALADDTATYTWTGAGDGTTWSNAANWSDDAGGAGKGWPHEAGSTALFPAGVAATVNFNESVTFGTLVVADANLNLVFTANDGVTVTCTTLNAGDTTSVKTRHGGRIVFDGVNLTASGSTEFRVNPGNDFILKGGSEISVYQALLCAGYKDSTFYTETTLGVEEGSTLTVRNLLQLGGAGTLSISNATVLAATVYLNGVYNSGMSYAGGGRIRFYGTSPRLEVSTKFVSEDQGMTGGLGADVEFFMPVGGYDAAPIQYAGTTLFMKLPNSGEKTPIRFIVRAESPILATDETGAWPLVTCANATIDPTGVNLLVAVSEVTEAITLTDEATTMTYARYDPASCLKITGAPREFGTGGYGIQRGIASGAAQTLAAPERDSANLTCTGYRIYDVAADGTRTFVSGGEGTTCSYTHGTTRREVVWQWSRPDVYVTETGAGEKTGEDWENAFDSIQAGIDKYDYAVVHVAVGTYTTTATTAIPSGKGVEVRGEGTDPSQVVLKKTAGETRVLSIDGALSTVTNITVTNGGQDLQGGVAMTDGLLAGCVVTNCSLTFNKYDGSGINMSGGVVSGCVITKNKRRSGATAVRSGGGIYMSGGLVEKCLITQNDGGAGGGCRGGGVYMAGGTLRGCLIERCSGGEGFGLYVNFAKAVENNTIVANKSTVTSGYGVVVDRRCAFRNNIVYGNTGLSGSANMDPASLGVCEGNCTDPCLVYGDGNLGDKPLFEDSDAGDYRLKFCPCVNGAVRRSWMDADFDLMGTPRVVGPAPDIGCFERPASQTLACSFTVASSGTSDLANVTLTSMVDGDTTGIVYYWRVIRADGTVYVKSGPEEAKPVFALGTGRYTVELAVTNGVGKDAFSKVEDAAKVAASVVYVNEKGSDAYPYTSRATGAHDFEAAFDLLAPGGTAYLAPGTYVVSNPIQLKDGAATRIISLEGPAETAIRAANVEAFTDPLFQPLVRISSGAAWLEGVTLVGGAGGPYYSGTAYGIGSAVEMSAGVMTNCVIRDTYLGHYNGSEPTMLMSGGDVSDLLLTGCRNWSIAGVAPEGAAVRITGGTIDRTIVSNCWTYGSNSSGTQGSVLAVKGGNVRNALVVGCTAIRSAPVYISSGYLENATIVCNTNNTTVDGREYAAGLLVGGGTARNLILSQNWSVKAGAVSNLTGSVTYTLTDDREVLAGVGNKTGDPKFRKGAGKKWRLKSTSPAINAGKLLDWMTETSVDLDGKPRVNGEAPDMGCYEGSLSGLAIFVR